MSGVSGMYPKQYSAHDAGTTIRNPATALLCIDSEDRFRSVSDSRSVTPFGALPDSPYNFNISKGENILSGFFTRLGVTEVVFPWTIPNVNNRSNTIYVEWEDGGPVSSGWITLTNGFYKPSELAATLQTEVRALDPVNLGAFICTYGANNEMNFSYDVNNGNWSIAFYPVTAANIPTLPTLAERTFWNSVDLNNTHQLFDLLGFTTDNSALGAIGAPIEGGYTLCQFTRYIDIVSTQLTYNQSLKDSSTSVVTRDILCRLYLNESNGQSTVSPSSPSFCPMGCAPFTIYRDYATPKFINWLPNQNIGGSLQLTVYDDSGAILDDSVSGNPYKNRTYWSVTLQVSEN